MLLQIPGVLQPRELETLQQELGPAKFEEGSATAGFVARAVKRNLQLAPGSPVALRCAPIVLDALKRNPMFFSAALPHRVQGPVFNRYDPGMTYGDHIDNAIMGSPAVRADIAATLFLTQPAQYDGGELVVQDNSGVHRIKLEAGSVLVYAANSIHRVEPVTRGTRFAAVLWAQSLVRDEARRRVLFDLDLALGSLRQKQNDANEVAALTSIYHNLLRMWAET